jgi:two-component system OmpR family response regulator
MPAQPLSRVFYVEDDEDIQRIVRLSLEKIGKLTVEVVSDPMLAIDRMIAFKPDLALLDWMMPGMDGPALLHKMREVPQTQAIPVVFITAKASQRELDELKKLGAVGTISKPFNPKDLPEQLRTIWRALP